MTDRYRSWFPEWEVVEGACPDGPWVKAEAIRDGATKASGDLLVVADADVWCDGVFEAVDNCRGWSIPHRLVKRYDERSTALVLSGADGTLRYEQKPYEGYPAGGIVVLWRDVLEEVPPDRRFAGWGQEDEAWACALYTIVGQPWRGDADLFHLWHPHPPRQNRYIGSKASVQLRRRYRDAASVDASWHPKNAPPGPEAMLELLQEA